MAGKIITDPKNLERDQVVCPSLCQLETVALTTYELAVDMSRHVGKAKSLDDTQHYRKFISACLKSMSEKIIAIKRLGCNYISEARAILRVHTEIAVDFFWLADHYKHKKEHADLLSKQFFLFRNKQFLAQTSSTEEALHQDHFLKPFFNKEGFLKDMRRAAQEDIRGMSLKGKNWRIAPGVTEPGDCRWEARCERSVKHAEEMANLKAAPFRQNLDMLSSYSHWDSIQTQEYEEDLKKAMFARDLNIAIGFVHDVMTGACSLADLELPEKAIIARHRFLYMST